jgi:hypothetical protein
VLEFLILHDIPDASRMFIFTGPANQPQIVTELPTPGSPVYGTLKLSPQIELLLYRQQLSILITSPEFPQGEISGEISVAFDWWVYLSGTNVVSPVTTASVGCATMRLEGDQNRRLNYEILHSVPVNNTLDVLLAIGKEGENGVVDRIFASSASPIRGDDIIMDDDELEAYVTDRAYLLVTSDEYPYLGEIRGTIKRVNPCVASNDNVLTVSVSDGVYNPQRSVTGNGGGSSAGSSDASVVSPSYLSTIACIFSFIVIMLNY